MKQKKNQLLAWLLTFAVVLGSQSVLVMAETFSDPGTAEEGYSEDTEIFAEEAGKTAETQSLETEPIENEVQAEEQISPEMEGKDQEQQETLDITEDQSLESEAEELLPEEADEAEEVNELLEEDSDFSDGADTGNAAGLSSGTVEEYQYPEVIEMLPGETYNLGQNFFCYVENEKYPDGENIPVKILEVQAKGYSDDSKIAGSAIYKMTKLSNGWKFVSKHPGRINVAIKYKDLHGKTKSYEFPIYIAERLYWMECASEDMVNEIQVNGQKKVQAKVYYRDAKHKGGVQVPASEYSLSIMTEKDWMYDTNVLKSVKIDGSSLKVTAGAAGDCGTEIYMIASSVKKNAKKQPVWQIGGSIWLNVKWQCEPKVRMKYLLAKNPEVGENFVLSNYKPALLKYDSSKSRWVETTDTKNIRYRLEFDEKLWKSTASTGNDLTRKLTRLKGEGTQIRVIAQERSTDSSGEHWNDIADGEIVLDAVCDKHNWKYEKTTKAATCTQKGTKTEKCTACGKTRTVLIAVDKNAHSWSAYKVTKAATVFKTGTKTHTCSRCKKKETAAVPKLKAKITLSASTLPLQKGKSAVVKISGLQKGDSVKSITVPSKYKTALKAEKTKTGDLKLTAKKASGTVKVTVTTAAKASKTVTVKLQSSAVKTKKITGVSSKLTVKKGKTASLKPVRNPISSQEKITYQSSDKKIATVDSAGKIKGIRPGKAVITVKAGTVKVKCTVTVTK